MGYKYGLLSTLNLQVGLAVELGPVSALGADIFEEVAGPFWRRLGSEHFYAQSPDFLLGVGAPGDVGFPKVGGGGGGYPLWVPTIRNIVPPLELRLIRPTYGHFPKQGVPLSYPKTE